MVIEGVEGKIPSDTPLETSLHSLNPPRHHWILPNTLKLPKDLPLSPQNTLDFPHALVRQSKMLLVCQRMSGETLGVMRVSGLSGDIR